MEYVCEIKKLLIIIKKKDQSQSQTLKGMRVLVGSTLVADIFFLWKLISLLISKHHLLALSYCYIFYE